MILTRWLICLSGVSRMKYIPYDWRTWNLICLSWGPLFFGAIFVTLFYYAVIFALSDFLFGGMNFYIYGILAGISGGTWSLGMAKASKRQDEIGVNISNYSDEKYKHLHDTWLFITLLFIGLSALMCFFIWLLKLY